MKSNKIITYKKKKKEKKKKKKKKKKNKIALQIKAMK